MPVGNQIKYQYLPNKVYSSINNSIDSKQNEKELKQEY